MKWINTHHITDWARRRDCQDSLPLLVRKLIRATCTSVHNVRFPAGSNIALAGWDGIVESTDDNEFVPKGISLWEFGTSVDPKGKADDDYDKRTSNPLGYSPSDCVFVFVTPRLWTKGEKWAESKRAEGIWKDVLVKNAEMLEEWLENAPTVSAWFAINYLGSYPSEGIQTTDRFWQEWITGPNLKFTPKVILGGRSKEEKEVQQRYSNAEIIAVQAASRDEALAFIVATFHESDVNEDFFARSLIVDSIDVFRRLSVLQTPLILIPRFDDQGIFNKAVDDGHTLFIPLGVDAIETWDNKIILPRIARDEFFAALRDMGMNESAAESYSKESSRNITILRRQLGFVRSLPEWAKPEYIRDIAPALIAGRWDESFENDKQVVSQFSNMKYEDYVAKLHRWRNVPDAPFVKVGTVWRVTSPLDAWINCSKNLAGNDFEQLSIIAFKVFHEIDPYFELELDKRFMASYYGKVPKYSQTLREGIAQSLVLVSIYGDRLKFDLPIKADLWVDRIVHQLLDSDNPLIWKSIAGKLRLISEASPREFLSSVEKWLNVSPSPIIGLFDEERGVLSSSSYHTDLLWALEGLSWFPEYLSRAALILSRLASVDPGGRLSNRPINSLFEIFKPWHWQTLSDFDERIAVLKLIASKEYEIAWRLLIGLLPSANNTAFPTSKMRWRMLDRNPSIQPTFPEIFKTHSAIINLLLEIYDFSEAKTINLIEIADKASPLDRERIFKLIENNIKKITDTQNLWHKIRKELSQHRSSPNAKWALSEPDLMAYEHLYHKLTPSDYIESIKWMFKESWLEFPEGFDRRKRGTEEQRKIILDRRIDALKQVYTESGLQRIIDLTYELGESWFIGEALGYILHDDDDIINVCSYLNADLKNARLVQPFIQVKTRTEGTTYILALFDKFVAGKWTDSALGRYLSFVTPSKEIWDYIELLNENIQKEYWTTVDLNFWMLPKAEKERGLSTLIKYHQYLPALHSLAMMPEEASSALLVDILEKVASLPPSEQGNINDYEIDHIFQEIDKREDIDRGRLLGLEWYYLPVLSSYGSSRTPKLLHDELTRNPDFFITVLKWVYKPDDDKFIEKEEITDEQLQKRAWNAHDLLESWRSIPGMAEKSIDYRELQKWINTVRKLAIECGRLEGADTYIGKILAQFPEDGGLWPPEEICIIIEELNSERIYRNFSSAVFNKRGSSVRGPYDGGERERRLAKYFHDLAASHRNKFPKVASVLEGLARGYEEDAKREDEMAEHTRLDF